MSQGSDLLEQARAAHRRRDWDVARDAFAAASQRAPLDVDDRAALADCAWWLGDLATALPLQQQVYAGYLGEDRVEEAAIVAVEVGYTMSMRGDEAQGSGWFARASRLADGLPEGRPHGILAYLDFETAFALGDLSTSAAAVDRVHDLGQRSGDPNLRALGALGEGRVLIRRGAVADGLRLLDEAMLAAVEEDLEPGWAGNIYCHLMAACDEIADLRRASEWTEATARWCEAMPGSGPFLGICRVHRARILHVTGAWDDAEREARRVCDELADLDVDFAAEAHYLIGELELQRGDLTAAEAAFRDGHRLGRDPQPGLALLRLARGDVAAASAAVGSALRVAEGVVGRSRLLPAAIEIALAEGELDHARTLSDELTEAARSFGTTGSAITALLARGSVLLSAGDAAAAVATLRDALRSARQVDVPFQVARIRQALARGYTALGDEEAASRERGAADTILARLGSTAGDDGDRVRPATPRDPAGLTPRETEVLQLVAMGRSNQDIAAQLVLSVRTVERHLASVYQKLGVHGRSARAAAVSYALREGILPPS